MYSKQTLNISGKRSVTFMGKKIAEASNRGTNEHTEDEWDTVRVFEVDPAWKRRQEEKTRGRVKIAPYHIGIAKQTNWEGDRDNYVVLYANNLPQVLGIVQMHLPALDQKIANQLGIRNAPMRTLVHEPSRSPVEP